MNLTVGQTKVLRAVDNINSDPGILPDDTTTWTTSDATKVSLSTAGPSGSCTITGVAAGNATITATGRGGNQATVAITVVAVLGLSIQGLSF